MVRAILTSKETWVRAMSLDEFTGLDPPGYKGAFCNLSPRTDRMKELIAEIVQFARRKDWMLRLLLCLVRF